MRLFICDEIGEKITIKRTFSSIGAAIGIMLATAIVVYAVTNLFFTKSETSDLSKKTVFQFDLSTGMQAAEVGPGDSFTVTPTIYNDATEAMYVFIVVDQPTCNDESLYEFIVEDGWKLVSNTASKQVYAYAGEEMTVLMPGETTDALTDRMTMKSITNADFSLIDDINIQITGYAIGIEDVSTVPSEAWGQCKAIGNIE